MSNTQATARIRPAIGLELSHGAILEMARDPAHSGHAHTVGHDNQTTPIQPLQGQTNKLIRPTMELSLTPLLYNVAGKFIELVVPSHLYFLYNGYKYGGTNDYDI